MSMDSYLSPRVSGYQNFATINQFIGFFYQTILEKNADASFTYIIFPL